jgi:hypothetical protein
MEDKPEFDITDGDWRVTGYYDGDDNITIYHKGEHFRSITVPGYKIWNVVAHFSDWIPALEAEIAPA